MWQSIDVSANMERPFGGDSEDKVEHTTSLLRHTLKSKKAAVFVTIDTNNTIIGTISGHVFDKPAVNISCVGVIYSLWVAEKNRKQGIAQALLTRLEADLINKGAQAFQVGWETGNLPAAAWWQKRGYSPYEVIASKIAKPKD
jgi:ribosomal protein S18 acetylase RimI-like enzyme